MELNRENQYVNHCPKFLLQTLPSRISISKYESMKYIIFFLYIPSLVACVTNERKKNNDAISQLPNNFDTVLKYADHADTSIYKNTLLVDTSNCIFFKKDRLHIAKLENKKCIIEYTGFDLFLRSENLKMWICKMPKQLSIKNIGDTILVTADVYELFGDENTWGKPTIIYRIATKR